MGWMAGDRWRWSIALPEPMEVHFGGPDRPPRALRDLLEARVDAVEAGGSIDWATYYFRDEALADALARAKRRGVSVRLQLEAHPRHRGANDGVIARLKGALGKDLRLVTRLLGLAHLHTKLYLFGGARSHALVGSFNPSGNDPEDPSIVADIGDQDRGHNLLVEVTDPALLRAFAERLADPVYRPLGRISARSGGTEAHFFPRRGDPLGDRLARLGKGSHLRIAASHVRDPRVAGQLAAIVSRGGSVDLLTHHTLRRSPERMIGRLRMSGVTVMRYEHPESLPMHAKFMLAEQGNDRWSAYGSYNLTRTSRLLNDELLMFADDPALWSALDARWEDITSEPWCRA
jgi:hypothetical protein